MSTFAFHANDLHVMREKRIEREFRAYGKMLDSVYKKIIMSERNGHSDLIYDVPAFITGMPLYSRDYAINYILHNLKHSGFVCYYMGESYIYINWAKQEKKNKNNDNQIIKEESKKEKKRKQNLKRYTIKRQIHVPEYKYDIPPPSTQFNNVTHSNNIPPTQIPEYNQAELLNRPDFSINNLRKMRNTNQQTQDYY